MLTDGTMTYQYDVMNQLISAETAAEKYTFKYDFEGRRYEAKKWTKNGDAWTPVQTVKYVYDEWNVIAEYVNGVKAKTYVWGEDLSGTMQGAGGVGGLLAEINASGTYLPVYDGNGNILSYKDLSGNTAATYVYDPFGSVLSHTGTDFAYKFSTKPETCGLYYYGFRYYSPALGRWLSRDPIREQGGMNLYGMVNNNINNNFDVFGLSANCCAEKTLTTGYRCCRNLKLKTEKPYNPKIECCCLGEIKTDAILKAERDDIITKANAWNVKSPSWGLFYQCYEQANALNTYLSSAISYKGWTFVVTGGRSSGFTWPKLFVSQHYASLVQFECGDCKSQQFILDAFKRFFLSQDRWRNKEVEVYSVEEFRSEWPFKPLEA